MIILAISDLHGVDEFPDVEPDIVFLLGDIDYYQLRRIDDFYTCAKFGVLGNHDGPDFFDDTEILNVHKQVFDYKGIKIAGFEGSPRYKRKGYLQYEEHDVEEFTNTIDKVDIFLSHANPMLEENFNSKDAHRGFKALTTFMKDRKTSFLLHGHIHESNEFMYEETKVLSVYPYKYFEF